MKSHEKRFDRLLNRKAFRRLSAITWLTIEHHLLRQKFAAISYQYSTTREYCAVAPSLVCENPMVYCVYFSIK